MEDSLLIELAEQFGTPLYVFDGDGITQNYNNMLRQLPENVEIFYSVKANPSLGICQLLNRCGSGIEVASSGELHLALKAGFQPHKIIFSGPGKIEDELEYAIEAGISAIIAESVSELEKLEQLAAERDLIVNAGIRLNPSYDLPNARIKMSGSEKQFGIDADRLDEVMSFFAKARHVRLVCIHIYIGTQIFEYEMIIAHVRQMLELSKRIIREYGMDLRMIDFGGGFGVPYFGESTPFDFSSFGKEIKTVFEEYSDICDGRRLIFESGRYMLARYGYFLTKVLYGKNSKGTKFLITDGGMNNHVLSTFRGRQMRNNFPLYFLGKTGVKETVTIAGPLCTPDDILGRNVETVCAGPGDILCIPNSGAYGLSYSPVHFLGHPCPAEVLRYSDANYVLRTRGKSEEILAGQQEVSFEGGKQDGVFGIL
ncbi:MAG TPA: type III PLP-dependent enzyme [Ruminiclostridium sp.]|nr:type III PLP-dependent enzyme [Ruminiclostridium sp.]